MEKKRIVFVSILFFLMLALNLLVVFFSPFSSSIQAKASDSGSISLRIIPDCIINITSPLNGSSYDFNYSDIWAVPLNVTSNCDLSNWVYDIYSYSLERNYYSNISFIPNSTAIVYHGFIDLVVRAQNNFGDSYSSNSTVYINISNSAPVLNITQNEFFICENDTLSYEFNAYDADFDTIYFDLYPTNPFFVLKKSQVDGFAIAELLSLNFDKIYIDNLKSYSIYELLISAYEDRDLDPLSDNKYVNVTVFEINNYPVIENIGSKTVWIVGENSSLNFNVNAFDKEDGMSTQGKLDFNISFQGSGNLFEINDTGFISYSPVNGHQGIYLVTVCVKDLGFFNDHPNFSVCLDQGDTNNSLSTCDSFFLTVTDENRAPQIINYSPSQINVVGDSYTDFYFNISSYDPDLTIPDIYWFIDGELKSYEEAVGNSSFSYSFGCGLGGVFNISAVASDGYLNSSVSWLANVNYIACESSLDSGGGAGGGSFGVCEEKWVCNSWQECENLELQFLENSKKEFIQEQCLENSFLNSFCGFQVRECFDLNSCNNFKFLIEPPEMLRSCYYTSNPSCRDGIKNCHSGGCEIGVDCGGPCSLCPSCSDGIKNQGEQGIDCGGPCPNPCLDPLKKATNFYLILIFILIAFLIIILFSLIIYKLYIIFFLHKEDDEKKRR